MSVQQRFPCVLGIPSEGIKHSVRGDDSFPFISEVKNTWSLTAVIPSLPQCRDSSTQKNFYMWSNVYLFFISPRNWEMLTEIWPKVRPFYRFWPG